MIEHLLLLVVLISVSSILFWTLKLGIGPVPSSAKVRKTVARYLPDNMEGSIFELGCGWGHLLSILEKKYPENPLIAFEQSPVPRWFARFTNKAIIKPDDFFTADLSQAGLIVCYLFPGAMERISKEIVPALKQDCWILTHTFALPDYQPEQCWQSDDLYGTSVYLYKINFHD